MTMTAPVAHISRRGVQSRLTWAPNPTPTPWQVPPSRSWERLCQMQKLALKDRVIAAQDAPLLGLMFIYKSGATAQIGDPDTVPEGSRQIIQFPRCSRFVDMSVGVRDGNISYQSLSSPSTNSQQHQQ
ncbi:hypothetical protein BDV10DRAFT_12386 [Aspergillus recurvatus]